MRITPKQLTAAMAALAAGSRTRAAQLPPAKYLASLRPPPKAHAGEREATRRQRQAERNRAKAFKRVGGEDLAEGWDCSK